MFNVDLRGYDHREVPVANAQDWKACKAGCDAGRECKAWTLVPERKICVLKWETVRSLYRRIAAASSGLREWPARVPDKAEQSKDICRTEALG